MCIAIGGHYSNGFFLSFFDCVLGSNVLALSWDKSFYPKVSYWTVYVHDKHESVILNTYGIKSLPYITVSTKDNADQTGKLVQKKKMRIYPGWKLKKKYFM